MKKFLTLLLSSVFLLAVAHAADKAPKEKAPLEATVFVDCAAGDTIANALATPALNLTIEISGTCVEDVIIDRTNVTLRGTDPLVDSIKPDPEGLRRQAVTLRNVSIITLENLTLTGAFTGIGINDSFGINVTNCRLENNEFAGAIVGTGSGSVNFSNTLVAAPSPPAGATPNRGIWTANGSSARCFDCTISDHREALLVTNGSNFYVNGGSYTGTRGAIDVFDTASANLVNAQITERVRVERKSFATLQNVNQTSAAFPNRSRNGSSLVLRGTTSLIGDAWIAEFSDMTLLDSSSTSGGLNCFNAGDAYCVDPLGQTSGSNCGQCPNP
jgi:hypothetical protein